MGYQIKTKDGWRELPIKSKAMPEEDKYKPEVIRCQSPVAEELVKTWQARMDSGEWPLKLK